MALSVALYTGLSALNGFRRGIEVTGNNIANANTYGFKSQRIEYKDSFYNTLNRSIAGDANFAGPTGPKRNESPARGAGRLDGCELS